MLRLKAEASCHVRKQRGALYTSKQVRFEERARPSQQRGVTAIQCKLFLSDARNISQADGLSRHTVAATIGSLVPYAKSFSHPQESNLLLFVKAFLLSSVRLRALIHTGRPESIHGLGLGISAGSLGSGRLTEGKEPSGNRVAASSEELEMLRL